ncbi:MAG TPA: cysteine--tRNA ligase [Candidatus Cloacimonetes bacterium]|mgnify:CR=1 FL=1|jgi:cysteinyl-tRNA synthetase|nr:cysteine--tRNA ligase [Candidatus Cloacimonas sp.]HHZ15985.1 cysteine--tRNA ligase [Candidatus Cloacimonadota bacterium]
MLIYNTATHKKETFVPIEEGKVKLYACGPTVYDFFHIGNARAFLFFDVMRRYFEYKGYDVTYVQNITDIEDKIIARSIEEGIPYDQFASKYADAFLQDSKALGIKPPHHQPRATEFMAEIIALIEELIKRGYAYEVEGDVYFDTAKLPEYGSLSGKRIEDQKVGARVAENVLKRNPTDFTLWKRSKPNEPIWQSPWGEGRPGWHSECVVMSQHYLGETFDIHGGGVDLVFPHHENELAQARAISGNPLANYWVHNGFLNIEGEKMSKSLDNFFTARDILKQHSAEAIRFFFLSKHYRSPIDFNREIIEESERAVGNFRQSLKDIDFLTLDEAFEPGPELQKLEAEFQAAMDDDFNSAKAIAVLFEINGLIRNRQLPLEERQDAARMLVKLGRVLGFFQNLEEAETLPDQSKQLIELIIKYRAQARADKNWALSDEIRADLAALGIELKDTPTGAEWSYKEQ